MDSVGFLETTVRWSRSRRAVVLAVFLVLTLLSLWAAGTRLGITTDTDQLFSSSLPWRQRQIEWDRAFPQFKDLIVAVIDAAIPEEADATAEALQAALRSDTAHFAGARRPDADPYLQRNGLLLLDTPQLGELLDRTIDAQPFLGQLVADPSARGLFAALSLIGIGVRRGEADAATLQPALGAFRDSLRQAADGRPENLSWQTLLAGKTAELAGPYRFVLASPRLDYGAFQPGGAATAALRAAAANLEFVQSGRARVRVTGSVALADEEFATVAQGMVSGTVASVVLVALWLILAVRSWRLIVPILATLILGLLLTVGFASVAVGTLNLVSVAFAVLFVGIAVDFAIQFSVRLREQIGVHLDVGTALDRTGRLAGTQIAVAAAATACGFLAFEPTRFVGVAELGLIAGAGMVVAFATTVTFLPALLSVFHPRPAGAEIGFAWAGRAEEGLARVRRPILLLFALVGALGVAAVPRLTFDSDPLHTKNPNTEAMRTLSDLMASPLTTPYSVEMLAPDRAAADTLAARLGKLPEVAQTLTLSSFVPGDQPAKLALIADAASLLGPTLAERSPAAPVTPEALRTAARSTAEALSGLDAMTPLGGLLTDVARQLTRLASATDGVVMGANAALTRFLPVQIARLRTALDAQPVSPDALPESLARDWRLPDGRVRVQAVGTPLTQDSAGLHALVAAVRAVAPDAGGSAATIVDTARTVVDAFRQAVIYALISISVVLLFTLRRLQDTVLVLAPLLLSALMTSIVLVAAGIDLNFANVIALPLLLGVGVSFNIYFVMNWRAGARNFLGTATARAVLFSALTTGTAFGSLSLSNHPGTASMGILLLISLGCTLVATTAFLPMLLRSLAPPGR